MDAYIDTMNANRQYVIDINAFFYDAVNDIKLATVTLLRFAEPFGLKGADFAPAGHKVTLTLATSRT